MISRAILARLHFAAERVDAEGGTLLMDTLAETGGEFLRTASITDEHGEPVVFSPEVAIGYGIMLGWLAAGGGEDPEA